MKKSRGPRSLQLATEVDEQQEALSELQTRQGREGVLTCRSHQRVTPRLSGPKAIKPHSKAKLPKPNLSNPKHDEA